MGGQLAQHTPCKNTCGGGSDSDVHIFAQRPSGETILALQRAFSALSLLISISSSLTFMGFCSFLVLWVGKGKQGKTLLAKLSYSSFNGINGSLLTEREEVMVGRKGYWGRHLLEMAVSSNFYDLLNISKQHQYSEKNEISILLLLHEYAKTMFVTRFGSAMILVSSHAELFY